jgi:hypothetical protein
MRYYDCFVFFVALALFMASHRINEDLTIAVSTAIPTTSTSSLALSTREGKSEDDTASSSKEESFPIQIIVRQWVNVPIEGSFVNNGTIIIPSLVLRFINS